jgi:predicted nucleic acid-binding protein
MIIQIIILINQGNATSYFHGPSGPDLGGREPAQIAQAILAEIEMIRHGGAGRKRLEEIMHLISTLPIQLVPADLELTRQAAEFKSSKQMSYADCYAAATAKLYKAELVTGAIEFEQVKKEVKIIWIH